MTQLTCHLLIFVFIWSVKFLCVDFSTVLPWVQDSASIAAMSRDKLIERQEKLQVLWNFYQCFCRSSVVCIQDEWAKVLPCMGFQDHLTVISTAFVPMVAQLSILRSAYDLRLLMVNVQAINKQSEELQDGAGNFASLAEELAKKIENRKWYEF